MNVKLLRKVAKFILAKPKRFDMANFGYRLPKKNGGPECGTVACIAGWAVILSQGIPQRADVPMPSIGRLEGMVALGISDEQAQRLFYTEPWPKQFAEYDRDQTLKAARIAVKRIEHFIRTKGKE